MTGPAKLPANPNLSLALPNKAGLNQAVMIRGGGNGGGGAKGPMFRMHKPAKADLGATSSPANGRSRPIAAGKRPGKAGR